ncbi:hypothetical protein KAU45_07865, partial [bacterium]|nr:hypothetical protein [bacterium]
MDSEEPRDLIDRWAAGELSPDRREAFVRAIQSAQRAVEGVKEKLERIEGSVSDRVEEAVGKALSGLQKLDVPGIEERVRRATERVGERLAEGREKLRRKLSLLDELDIARLIEQRLKSAVMVNAPRNLGASVLESVHREGRRTVVIPRMRRSILPSVLTGFGILVALAAVALLVPPLFGLDLGLDP